MRRLNSILILILFLISLTTFVSASSHISFRDYTVDYGEEVTVIVDCSGSSKTECNGGPLLDHELEVCGEVAATTGGNAFGPTNEYKFTFKVPQGAACTLGKHEFTFDPDYQGGELYETSGGELNVVETDMVDEHVAPKMVVGLNTGGSVCSGNNVREFYLSDYNPTGGSPASPSMLLIEHNCAGNNKGQAESDIGHVLEPSEGEKLDAIVQTCPSYSSAPCHIKDEAFDTSFGTKYEDGACYSGGGCDPGDTISPLHDGSNGWYPDGEIAVGRYPDYYYEDSSGNNVAGPANGHNNVTGYYFVCRDGANMVTEEGSSTTSQVVDVQVPGYSGEYLMKCDQSTGEWNHVKECEDGLDNDGDGQIDYGNDWGCNSATDDDESGDACQAGVVRETINSPMGTYQGLVAQYKTSSGCSTDGSIYYTDSIVASTSGGLDKDPDYTTCTEGVPYWGGPCASRTFDYAGFNETTMPVVEYWPTLNYFQQLERADSSIDYSSDVYQTDFVADYIGWKPKVQSLYDAEKKYYPYGDTCVYGVCHQFWIWEDQIEIRMPEVEQAYNNSDSSLNIEAWHHNDTKGPYNAGVNATPYSSQKEVLSKDSSPEAVFDGGFAGKCESDEVWQYVEDDNRWKCSGDIPWEQTVYLPEFDNDSHAGLIFPPYNFKNSQADLPDYIYEYNTTLNKQLGAGWDSFETAAEQMDFLFTWGSTDVDSINARCWNGTKSLTEGQVHNTESYIQSNFNVNVTDWMNINVPSDPSDPVADYRPLDHDGSYSCYWNITTTSGDKVSDIQDDTFEIHKHLGKSSPSGKVETVVKNITEDSIYASDLPDMTGSDHTWTESDLNSKMSSWN